MPTNYGKETTDNCSGFVSDQQNLSNLKTGALSGAVWRDGLDCEASEDWVAQCPNWLWIESACTTPVICSYLELFMLLRIPR